MVVADAEYTLKLGDYGLNVQRVTLGITGR
jgi:hypothetical protein